MEVVGARLEGKALLTGGSGFLGRAFMQRALDESWPCEFTVFSRDEQKQDVIKRRFKNARCVLGDVRDTERLQLTAVGHDYVIHMGALKFIPEAEFNASECIGVNLLGSKSVIRATRGIVPTVLAISTDKAVMPLNVYGATKMLMERLFVEADLESSDTRYGTVRYGNVVGSTGSLIPVFERMASELGHVTVTDPDMTRFWMSANDAVDLVLYGLSCLEQPAGYQRGEVVINMAPAMRLGDLVAALELEDWAGLPVKIDIIGRRAGEKMDEALYSEYESTKLSAIEGSYAHIAPLMDPGKKPSVSTIGAYESSNPRYWLSPDTLREYIAESRLI